MSLAAQLFQVLMLFVLLLAFSYLGWLFSQSAFWRGRWAGEKDEIIPEAAPRLALRWRAVQAVAIAALGLSVLFHLSTAGGGVPLNPFGYLHTPKALIVLGVTAAAALVILFGALLALAGGTVWGCWFAALALFAFGALNAGSWSLIDQLCPGDSAEAVTTYWFEVEDRLPGVEIWVNDVYLGKTPLGIRREEFLARVPMLATAPGTTATATRSTPGRPGFKATNMDYNPLYFRFELNRPTSWRPLTRSASMNQNRMNQDREYYFARARLDGEWGQRMGPGVGSGGGGGGRYRLDYHNLLLISFPGRIERIQKLLTQAQAAHFQPTAEWFQALAALNPTAWRLLGELARKDPGLNTVRSAWATWRYGLDQATTPEAAWQAMEAIAREAETHHEFDTESVAGLAVALLAPRLDLERLIGEAVRLLRKHGGGSWWYSYTAGNRFEFSGRSEPGGPAFNQVPLRAYVIAQAIHIVGEQIKAKQGHYPPIFQRQLAPELVRTDTLLNVAANYGGPEVETYLLRQPWNKRPQPGDYENVTFVGGSCVNIWLKLLAGMNNDIGRRFRGAHRQEVLDLAYQMLGTNISPEFHFDDFAFLFLDPQMALEFWPSYRARLNTGIDLANQWKYLVKMDSVATVEMYLEPWRQKFAQAKEKSFFNEPWALRELEPLQPVRQAEILNALQRLVEEQIAERIKAYGKYDSMASDMHNFMLNEIQPALKRLELKPDPTGNGPSRSTRP